MESKAFQNKWEEIYSEGRHLNRYPWDMVVSFIYRNYPRDKSRDEINILEVGSGAGNNLWFAAREGFRVSGIDGSASAVAYAHERFVEEGLVGDFRIGDFTKLPFSDNTFDLVIDRASITYCNFNVAKTVINEVQRVMKNGGKFMFVPYSERHSSFVSGTMNEEGLTCNICEGTVGGTGGLYFYSKREIFNLFESGWRILSVDHMELMDELYPKGLVHAEWRVITEKI